MELTDIQKAIEEHATATAATIAKQDETIAALKANLIELEQKAADGHQHMPGARSDLADTLVKNPQIDAVSKKLTRDTSVEGKAMQLLGLETKNTITDNAGDFHNVTGTGIFGGLERRRFIIEHLRIVPVNSGHVAYSREVSFTNAAAEQAAGSPLVFTEGAPKAESSIVYELIDQRLPTTAHFIKASNQVLADVPQMRNLLDGRLRFGLAVKTDAQIVATMTTAGNFTAFTPTSGDDGIASINRAIAALETEDAMATLCLLNPTTYRSLQRLRATGGNEQHILGSPAGINREAVWNVSVLPSNAVPAGKLLLIDAETLGEYYLRASTTIDIGYVNEDFTKNLVTIRAENRGQLAIIRPVSIMYGSLTL
jgi:hypothetical protein